MSAEDPLPYNGTIHTFPNEPVKEFFRLPTLSTNQLDFSVQAASGVSLLLYNKDVTSDSSEYKVIVNLGSDGNSTTSIGLSKEDVKYTNALESTKGVISATHFKTFTVRWYKGRVMLFNHGFDKPFITFDGPKELGFSNIGVRTVGCSGDWRVQGLPKFTTADTKEYHDIEINTGRLDFEIQAWHDCYMHLFPDMKMGDEVLIVIGGWNNGRSSWLFGGAEQGFHRDWEGGAMCEGEYRKYWIKWDATNLYFGKAGSTVPVSTVLNWGTPFKTFKYFGIRSVTDAHADWHIMSSVGPYDVGKVNDVSSSTAPVAPTQGGGGNEVGYVTYNYTY